MPLTVTLDDAAINAFKKSPATHQTVVQGSDYIPVVVNLVAEITLGLAILTAIAADDDLWAEFNDMPEEDILAAITSVAIVTPAEAVDILAYSGAGVHKRPAPAGEVTYLPFSRLFRNYVNGGATLVVLDVGVAV